MLSIQSTVLALTLRTPALRMQFGDPRSTYQTELQNDQTELQNDNSCSAYDVIMQMDIDHIHHTRQAAAKLEFLRSANRDLCGRLEDLHQETSYANAYGGVVTPTSVHTINADHLSSFAQPFEYQQPTEALQGEPSVSVAADRAKELLQKIKDAGVAGVLSFGLVQTAFWAASVPVCVVAYGLITGHFPEWSNEEDMAAFGAEAFAWVNLDAIDMAQIECIQPLNFYDGLFSTVLSASLILIAVPLTCVSLLTMQALGWRLE